MDGAEFWSNYPSGTPPWAPGTADFPTPKMLSTSQYEWLFEMLAAFSPSHVMGIWPRVQILISLGGLRCWLLVVAFSG